MISRVSVVAVIAIPFTFSSGAEPPFAATPIRGVEAAASRAGALSSSASQVQIEIGVEQRRQKAKSNLASSYPRYGTGAGDSSSKGEDEAAAVPSLPTPSATFCAVFTRSIAYIQGTVKRGIG